MHCREVAAGGNRGQVIRIRTYQQERWTVKGFKERQMVRSGFVDSPSGSREDRLERVEMEPGEPAVGVIR